MRLGLSILIIAIGLCACDTNKSSKVAPKSYSLPSEIKLTVSAERNSFNGVVIVGETNLPDGTKLGVELTHGEKTDAQDFSVFVSAGKFRSASFSKGVASIPAGKQEVHIFTYFNEIWQSKEILRLVGNGGQQLKLSIIIRVEDSMLVDGDKVLDYSTVLLVPELNEPRPPDPETSAINLTKKAVLIVDGSRSSMNVEDGFKFFCGSPGIRNGEGWAAEKQDDGSFNVILDFINGEMGHEKAIWNTNLKTKRVIYRNKNAKYFSWIPKD